MKRVAPYLILVLVALLIGVSLYLAIGQYAATDRAHAAMVSGGGITVTEGRYISFQPESPTTSGIIYYPGGKVAPQAYAPLAHELAKSGHAVYIVRMPFNLAVLGSNRGGRVIRDHPEIRHWVIAGHSLGGVMAAEYALKQPAIEGLILYGAFVQPKPAFADADLAVLSVAGTHDGLATLREVSDGMAYLPDDAQLAIIQGSNHSQFGDYGLQQGDLAPTRTDEEALSAIVSVTTRFLAERDAAPTP